MQLTACLEHGLSSLRGHSRQPQFCQKLADEFSDSLVFHLHNACHHQAAMINGRNRNLEAAALVHGIVSCLLQAWRVSPSLTELVFRCLGQYEARSCCREEPPSMAG